MPIEILMPALSPTMTEGKLAKWLKKEGDAVKSGDLIAEIETDKATMEFEAVDDGKIGKILVPEGTEGVAVNKPIAILLEAGEDMASAKAAPKAAAPKPAPVAAAPVAVPVAAAQPARPQVSPTAKVADRLFASPLAKRMAANAGIDLSAVKGSGPHGRIVKADVDQALAGGAAKAAPAAAAAPRPAVPSGPVPDFGQPFTAVPNSSVRKIIAKRLLEAKQTIPHFYLTVECNIDELMALRAKLNARPGANYKLSVNDFVIKAVAAALKKVPAANATWTDEAIRRYDNVDISVAVATPDGLITPIIRNADKKGLAAISNEMKDLAGRAKDKKLKPEEFQGGGFSISNLGMFGIKEFSAIINPPQSCILAVGKAEQRPIVKNGAIAIATMMSCTLSVDHRSVDGAVGAEFMQAFQAIIEEPITVLL
ncbi:MAG: pyruvate dehydrogenase complex dihydrolipoamide acetyltransferase [Rhodospirillaceae bacterium]|nr:pyruvate dehydrogenase complex dihydrolipoamide acetyltransferase [Rhodospirillaceae bacterium]